MKAEEVRLLMNECGKASTPFLFAIDFEMQNGIFRRNPTEQKDILFRTTIGNNCPDQESASLSLKQKPFNCSESGFSIEESKPARRNPHPLVTQHLFDPCKEPTPAGLNPKVTYTPIPYHEYKKRFNVIMEGLKHGNSYLANLTVRTPVRINLSMKEIFLLSNSSYGIYMPEQFVCFSPERFVKISNGVISTNPMKGTISADIREAEQIILSDHKETAEHCTVVDLLRNDIGMVATDIRVNRFRYIDRIVTRKGDILQVSSEISGKLTENYQSSLGDIIFRLLPAGSICGAPKQSTLRIISRAEPEPRGYYSGVFGYFNGKECDTAVMIRFIEQTNGLYYFRSGGGITVNSIPENEYNEVLEKIYLPF